MQTCKQMFVGGFFTLVLLSIFIGTACVSLGANLHDIDEECKCLMFKDTNPNQWYHNAVDFVVENNIMNGVSLTKFNPNGDASRSMIAAIIWRLEGCPDADACSFKDVQQTSWYYQAVNWAESAGVVTGYSENRFGPDDPVTREQLAAILYRYAHYRNYDTIYIKSAKLNFTDINKINSYAYEPVEWAVHFALIGGMGDGTISPAEEASRAQVAAILMRFCDNVCSEQIVKI